MAAQDIAEGFGVLVIQADKMLAGLDAQPTVTRDLLLRRIVEAWLRDQGILGKPAGEWQGDVTTESSVFLEPLPPGTWIVFGSSMTITEKNLDRRGAHGIEGLLILIVPGTWGGDEVTSARGHFALAALVAVRPILGPLEDGLLGGPLCFRASEPSG